MKQKSEIAVVLMKIRKSIYLVFQIHFPNESPHKLSTPNWKILETIEASDGDTDIINENKIFIQREKPGEKGGKLIQHFEKTNRKLRRKTEHCKSYLSGCLKHEREKNPNELSNVCHPCSSAAFQ